MKPSTYHFILGALTILLIGSVFTFNLAGLLVFGGGIFLLNRWHQKNKKQT